MASPPKTDVWAPPRGEVGDVATDDGPELAFRLSGAVHRREARAWLRKTRWWAGPFAAVGFGLAGSVGFALTVAVALTSWWGAVFLLAFVTALLWMTPFRVFGIARRMTQQRLSDVLTELRVVEGRLLMTSTGQADIPAARISAVKERSRVWWLMVGKRAVIFVSKTPQRGSVAAFMRQVHEARARPEEPVCIPAGLAQASFRPPRRWSHAMRTYAVALRNGGFVALIVLQVLLFVFGLAALPWPASRDLAGSLFTLCAALTLLLLAPGLWALTRGRDALGEPGSRQTYTVTSEHLRIDGAIGVVIVPWAEVVGLRRIARFGLLELSSGRVVMPLSDVVHGDGPALFDAIDAHCTHRDAPAPDPE